MVGVSASHFESLENWSPVLFLFAGGLVIGHAAIRGVEAFTDVAPPPDVFGPTGYLLAVLGLLGLYPALADRTPRLARTAAVVAAVPLVGWVIISASSFGEVAGVLPSESWVLPGVFFVVHLVTMVLTYVLFGVASLRAGVHSRTVGRLLLVPPALFVVMMAGGATVGYSAPGAFVVGSGLALAHLSIGAVLWAGTPTDHQAPSADATAS